MAEEEDTPAQIEENAEEERAGHGSENGSGSEDEEEGAEEGEEEIEWLATTRERRTTAGNRMRGLLAQEDPDDDLELLFAEADDDAGFEDDQADEDVQMDSSDDDEDQGPAAGDDLEGEKELQKQAKAEKAKKRKLEGGMPKMFKKRVKIDPTASQVPPPRPKKKSERMSWLPTPEDAPTRASQRGTTKQSKQQLHVQMQDREIKRLRQLANMEKAAAKKEATKKPALTQADRLKEAARVEKANSKSLSRWEQAEQEREEEQRAKLAALHNRKLEGPVISWWSGQGEWVGGKLKKVGQHLTIEEKEKPTRKRKAAELEDSENGSVAPVEGGLSNTVNKSKQTEDSNPGTKASSPTESSPRPPKSETAVTNVENVEPPSKADVPPVETIPPPPPPHITPIVLVPPRSSVLAPPAGLPLTAPPPPLYMHSAVRSTFAPPPAFDGSAPLPGLGYNFHPPPRAPSVTTPFALNPNPPAAIPEGPPPPPAIEHGTINYVILENFDEDKIREKNCQTMILFNRTFPKATRAKASHELCVITGQPAKYRDPRTDLPYFDSRAYKEIKKLTRGEYKWSKFTGAYVGPCTKVAEGVPARFREALVKPAAGPATST